MSALLNVCVMVMVTVARLLPQHL